MDDTWVVSGHSELTEKSRLVINTASAAAATVDVTSTAVVVATAALVVWLSTGAFRETLPYIFFCLRTRRWII